MQAFQQEELDKTLSELVPGGIQWYPGHMAKATRELSKYLKLVNTVIEVVDARLPGSSRHPNLAALASGKQIVIALTKDDLAQPDLTLEWAKYFRSNGTPTYAVDAGSGAGIKHLVRAIRSRGSNNRVLVVGVPNTGKSTLINRLCRRSATKTGARPGVTRGPQWLQAGPGIQLLDTPGLLWPKIDSLQQGLKLVWAGCVGENAYRAEEVGAALALWLKHFAPEALQERYGFLVADQAPFAVLEQVGRRRGCLITGGRVDLEKASNVLLQDFRVGYLGRITLDSPPIRQEDSDA